MPYEVRAKAGEGAFSVVVETAKQALAKVDELLEQADVDDVSVRTGLGKSWIWARSKLRRQRHRRGGRPDGTEPPLRSRFSASVSPLGSRASAVAGSHPGLGGRRGRPCADCRRPERARHPDGTVPANGRRSRSEMNQPRTGVASVYFDTREPLR